MDRKGRISGNVLTLLSCLASTGCMESYAPDLEEECTVTISVQCPSFRTRTEVPDEDRITDMNLIIFEDGKAETAFWESGMEETDALEYQTTFVKGRKYSAFAMANTGEQLDIGSIEDLKHVTAEVSEMGFMESCIPMSAYIEEIPEEEWGRTELELVRMAAKISVSMDRSRLSEDVEMTVKSVRIGNWPRYALAAGPSKTVSVHDRYEKGYELTHSECEALNRSGYGGVSEEVSVYMLENMQGSFPHKIEEDEEKVLEADDSLYSLASYMEMEIYYSSDRLISYDSNLIYRFYLGGSRNDLDIERNCHYHIMVTPEDDGLSGNGWRVDKSGIGPSVPYFRMQPGEIVEGHVGDSLRIWCECYPRTSPFDPGYEELNYDKSRGIYDYKVDDDGHGVTLYLKKPGTGIVYMSAGEPINQDGMVIIVVNR